jgi:hypothetical protein
MKSCKMQGHKAGKQAEDRSPKAEAANSLQPKHLQSVRSYPFFFSNSFMKSVNALIASMPVAL